MRALVARVTRAALIGLAAGTLLLLCSRASFAGTPTLGSDCGEGAALVGTSSDSAGKVTLGSAPGGTCTLTFGSSYTNAPACSATDETASRPMAVNSTTETVVIGGYMWSAGDVVAYLCASY